LAEGLAAAAGRMEPGKAAEVCGPVARRLLAATKRKPARSPTRPAPGKRKREEPAVQPWPPSSNRALVKGLAAAAGRLEPADAAGLLLDALANTRDRDSLRTLADSEAIPSLAEGLSAAASRMEPGKAACLLLDAMAKTRDPNAVKRLAEGLSAVAGRLEPDRAAEVCGKAAQLLLAAIEEDPGAPSVRALAEGLSEAARRMEPGKAEEACGRAARLIFDALEEDPTDPGALAEGLSAAAGRLEPGRAADLLLDAMARTYNPETLKALANGLSAAAARLQPDQSPQRLVDLLKRPECIGDARERILVELGQRFPERPGAAESDRRLRALPAVVGPIGAMAAQRQARAFAGLWECVDYLEKHHPEIDLASPPRRPRE
jgi:hypothetical protein